MSIQSKFVCRTIVCAALGLFFDRGMSAEPANPRANAATRAVLNYVHELAGRTGGNRILSGQFSDFGNGANLRIMERVHEQTGHWPALIGVDYADFPRGSLTTKTPNQVAIDYWKQGGLVTVMAHIVGSAHEAGHGHRTVKCASSRASRNTGLLSSPWKRRAIDWLIPVR